MQAEQLVARALGTRAKLVQALPSLRQPCSSLDQLPTPLSVPDSILIAAQVPSHVHIVCITMPVSNVPWCGPRLLF